MDYKAVLLLILFPISTVSAEGIKCNISVDITNGVQEGTSIISDGITYTENDYYINGSEIRGCICNVKQCLRKCCLEGETLNLTSKSCESELMTNSATGISTYHIVNVPDNQICEEEQSRVKLEGNFQVVEGILVWEDEQYSLEYYCVDRVEDSRVAILCVTTQEEVNRLILVIGMIISMPFLLATFLVYAILPESNLHRKALMNYVLTLFLAYIFLVIVQLYPGKFDENFVCPALGYLIIFFFLISFFWMNVMCLDMWFAFRGMRGFNGRRLAEKKRFLMYFAYAVGVPSLHILVVFLINKFGNNESDYFPGIGYEKCFLRDGLPNLLYFYGPMAILITVNVTLFILTAVKIQRVKKETSMLKQSDSKRHSYEDDKQNITEHVNKKTNTLYRFNLYVKLLFAMGINWTMEVISWAIEWRTKDIPSYIWYLTDFCNAMYGVFIFFIFVFKKKIWRSLKKRYYVFIGKPHFAHSVSVTQTTRSSNYSTTETGLNDHRLSELNNGRGEERMLHQN
ncbi:probable G-protein coupled receptor Mth-like 10 isoform X5 [Anoplophora glabripennis]|uniref:probable G-protein coupled receptor Mth-like 10 isoform X5 n=1 Tax=Anoplophora glabripennis TaxID=217634 RepID=UPI00087429CB|nr:probable G-protein coupled receptor Mth-like 10 isoform X5 [Anoplophora glabripennis]